MTVSAPSEAPLYKAHLGQWPPSRKVVECPACQGTGADGLIALGEPCTLCKTTGKIWVDGFCINSALCLGGTCPRKYACNH